MNSIRGLSGAGTAGLRGIGGSPSTLRPFAHWPHSIERMTPHDHGNTESRIHPRQERTAADRERVAVPAASIHEKLLRPLTAEIDWKRQRQLWRHLKSAIAMKRRNAR